ncbi:MAG: NAD(P)H-dependent oxidoreductase [Phycisphaerales bacterium]|nr:NAD(P)H-dependent oxidoreductase [Phycisphaerales bacterium]
MKPINVAVFVGSLRQDSYNRRLANAIEKLAPADLKFKHIRIDDLPLYNQDFDKAYPPACQRLKQEVQSADALLFVTPEYNRSIPGVLKNALDIASRPWGTNSFAGKPAAICGISIGAVGTAISQQHLRGSLAFLDAPTMTQPEMYLQFQDGMIEPDGTIGTERTTKFIQGFVDRYAQWVRKFVG